MSNIHETKNATNIRKTSDVKPHKVRKAVNSIFDELQQQVKTLKTSYEQTENEIVLSFSNGHLIGSFHLQELSNQPIADATQLSFPLFAQEGGKV